MGGILYDTGEGTSDDGKWFYITAGNEATPTQSYYIFCYELPSKLVFGVENSKPQYTVKLK